tara:strand:- start:1284 stop:2990 length:1707 start_codon:yes stop_codon:yes gene_type:complete
MFVFQKKNYFIILFFTLLFINSCNQTDIVNSKIIIDNTISKPLLTNKKIIVNKKNNSLILNAKKYIKKNDTFVKNENSKIIKNNLNLLYGKELNVKNENDVVFEFRNERLLEGRELSNQNLKKKTNKALTAVFKMLKSNPSLENQNLNLKNEENLNHSIDYSLKLNQFPNNIVVKNIIVFLPFTGPYSNNFGNKIRKAIDLSILRFGTDNINVVYFDTGTNYLLEEVELLIEKIKPEIILGPFTRASVLKLKPYIKENLIPMFAFTNDIALVEKNIWSLGFSPEEQIDSIIKCSLDKGHKNYGLIVPNDLYGEIILNRAIDNLSEKSYTSFKKLLLSNTEMTNKSKLESILKRFLDYNKEQNQMLMPKFDAIFIGGNENFVLEIAPLLAFFDIDSQKVQILGTEKFNVKAIKNEPSLEGAWFPRILDREDRNELIIYNKEEDELKKIKEDLNTEIENNNFRKNNLKAKRLRIVLDRKARIKEKDFTLVWKNTWGDDVNYFSKVGFDTGILAINFLNQDKKIEEYIENIEGLVTGFKFAANGYVKKLSSVVEIQKLGKLQNIRDCFNNN